MCPSGEPTASTPGSAGTDEHHEALETQPPKAVVSPELLGIASVRKPVGVDVAHIQHQAGTWNKDNWPCVSRIGVLAQMSLPFLFLLRFSVLCQVLQHMCFLPTPMYSTEHKSSQYRVSPGLSRQLQPHPKPPLLLCLPLETTSSDAAAETKHKRQSKR